MREQLDTRLYDAFLAAAADREQIKVFRDLAENARQTQRQQCVTPSPY